MVNREDYLRELNERQQEHLNKVFTRNWQPCMHDNCTECVGTGIKLNGQPCAHGISCPCPKCSPYSGI